MGGGARKPPPKLIELQSISQTSLLAIRIHLLDYQD